MVEYGGHRAAGGDPGGRGRVRARALHHARPDVRGGEVSAASIELVRHGVMVGSQPDARLLATLVTDGPVRVELVVRRQAGALALDATGWLDDEEPAWPV